MSVCPKCSAESPEGTVFCTACGASMSEPAPTRPAAAYLPPSYEVPPKKGMPTWGWILIVFCGVCCCGVILIVPAILFPVFSQAKLAAKRSATLANEKQIAIATIMYSSDFDDLFPYAQDSATAREVIRPYANNDSVFVSLTPGASFDWNLNIGGVNSTTIDNPLDTPMWLETVPDPTQKVEVAFVDGHTRTISPDELPGIKTAAQRHFNRLPTSKPLPPNYKPPAAAPGLGTKPQP